MNIPKKVKIGLIILGHIIVAILIALYGVNTDRENIQYNLRIEALPQSLKNEDCESHGVTDFVQTCYFEIESGDFEKVIRGWDFVKNENIGKGLYECGIKLDISFEASDAFIARPKEFEHGGSVELVADKEHQKVCVELWKE